MAALKGSFASTPLQGSASAPLPTMSAADLDSSKGVRRLMNRVTNANHEWRKLQSDIRSKASQVTARNWNVQAGINEYRITLSSASFKSKTVDDVIWELSQSLEDQLPPLSLHTYKMPLSLRTRKQLREIDSGWTEAVNTQDRLLETLSKAPKLVDFYNRIHLARIQKVEQEEHEAEIARRSAAAHEAIDRAIDQIVEREGKGESITRGSTILRLEDARNYWSTRLQELGHLETASGMDAEDVIHLKNGLEETINDAPGMAERVKEVEVMFTRLMSMHEELGSYGKNVIPQEDLARMLITIQEEIPKLWSQGSWEKMRRSLNEVTSFVKFYDLPVRSELSVAERRKPGLARTLISTATALPLNQAMPLVRSLVGAIDARDRFMRGHSDTVAKVVMQAARRMNWSGEDLELLELAALLHDVGKIVIPEALLTKQDPLTRDEWNLIRQHPYHGARILKPLDTLNRIIPWIYHHQERWDGAGYPDGLSTTSIPAAARLISVAEAFTVMTTEQPKRKAMTTEDALGEISRGAGTQFDPEMASTFVDAIRSAPPEEFARSSTPVFTTDAPGS
ncbi:MAG: HD domain-containing phosphohydrolase [Anaerolineaceae bacterium]